MSMIALFVCCIFTMTPSQQVSAVVAHGNDSAYIDRVIYDRHYC